MTAPVEALFFKFTWLTLSDRTLLAVHNYIRQLMIFMPDVAERCTCSVDWNSLIMIIP